MSKKFEWLTKDELLNDINWWKIYFNSFPTTELDSINQLSNALAKGLAKIARYQIEDNTVAIIVLYHIKSVPFIFLNFFAIAKKYRNLGLGNKLFSLIVDYSNTIYTKSTGSFGLIWEVEDPRNVSIKKKELASKRIRFYKNQGAKLLPGVFIQPPLAGSHDLMMRLMYVSQKSEKEMADAAKLIKQSLYFEKYHRINNIGINKLEKLLIE